MKKIICSMMLVISINGGSFAQKTSTGNSDKLFELPENSIRRRFTIDLDKGNKMQIELSTMKELEKLSNIDSLLKVFVRDIQVLKDSLANELESKRIDYLVDSSSYKQLRLQRFQPGASHFLVNDGEASSLKIEQDTITITGKVPAIMTGLMVTQRNGFHYYRVSFFLNDIKDLATYLDGRLNEKIKNLGDNVDTKWESEDGGTFRLKNNPGIRAANFRGYTEGGGDFLSLRLSVDVQNYKNYFVPSISAGATITTNRNMRRQEFSAGFESHFMFSKDSSGKLAAFRNSFVTIGYGWGSLRDNEVKKNSNLYPYFSLGYLVKSRGNFYDKNTFKLGLARWSLFGGSTKIEPTIYFNNFFKGITPSLRITQNF